MLSMSGDRPPWTHRMAPVSLREEPLAEPEAAVPGAPTLVGVGGATGLEEPMCGLVADTEDCESELRAYRYMISPAALRVSISMSWSRSGRLSRLLLEAMGPSVGWREVAAPVTRAPRAR